MIPQRVFGAFRRREHQLEKFWWSKLFLVDTNGISLNNSGGK